MCELQTVESSPTLDRTRDPFDELVLRYPAGAQKLVESQVTNGIVYITMVAIQGSLLLVVSLLDSNGMRY